MACGCDVHRETVPIEDVNNLGGWTIGVMLAWGPDYALTGREDVDLVRYSRLADLVIALGYQRVDAVAVEDVVGTQILLSVSGLRRVEDPILKDGMVALTKVDREDLLAEFNEFISEFKNTEEYEDLYERAKDPEGYKYKEVPLSGGDKIIKVGICDDNYPFTYKDSLSGECQGIDIEVLHHFADKYGYSIEYVGGSWNAMSMDVTHGRVDMAVSGVSNLFRGEFEAVESALVSDIYLPIDVVLIEVEDVDQVKIKSYLEG